MQLGEMGCGGGGQGPTHQSGLRFENGDIGAALAGGGRNLESDESTADHYHPAALA